jgi:protein-S-isoprenylcysteine O-methyltransferase Ste14
LQSAIYFLLNVQAAILFLVRTPADAVDASSKSYLICLSSFSCPFLMHFPPEFAGTMVHMGQGITFVGSVICLLAVGQLGRGFGVLPAVRRVTTGGIYRLIRHPIYAANTAMEAGLLLSYPTWWNAGVCCLSIWLVTQRIALEERLLERTANYASYSTLVPYRLFPFLY